jgi:hypothetical protein
MPPRAAQKRKTDDGPYALSGIKRPNGNGGGSSHALYPTREHRERESYTATSMREQEWYDKYGSTAYEKDVTSHTVVNPSSKRRKADPANGAGPAYYQTGMVGNPMIRGEEGPLITVSSSYSRCRQCLIPRFGHCRWIWRHCPPQLC